MKRITIGFDLAKHVFQVHGIDESGAVIIRRRLRRSEVSGFFRTLEPSLVGMEACATSHFWARELLALGHEVRLMPPSYVKPYVKRGKNDAADAQAICEAVTRPTMRFVPVKSATQQSVLMLHRVRDLLIRQRTMLVNALRAQLSELGIIAAKGMANIKVLTAIVRDESDGRVPPLARMCLTVIIKQLGDLEARIANLTLNNLILREVTALHASDSR